MLAKCLATAHHAQVGLAKPSGWARGHCGLTTERDPLQRVVAQRRAAAAPLVEDVMTTEVACCGVDTTIDEVRGVLKNRRIRHLPVIDADEQLLALISIGDLNAYQTNTQE